MRKLFTIAGREYRAAVGTKAFLLSIVMMPIMMFGGLVAMNLMSRVSPLKEHEIVIVDSTGQLFDRMKSAADARNEMIIKARDEAGENESKSDKKKNPFEQAALFHLKKSELDSLSDDDRLELSNQIRAQQLYAFVELPKDIFDSNSKTAAVFCSENPAVSEARRWIRGTVQEIVRSERFRTSGIDKAAVDAANSPVRFDRVGLWTEVKSSDGTPGQAKSSEAKDELTAMFLPMGILMLMFMVIFLAAQPAMESVLEEKSQRIAEVLLGSASPFQLMAGKLIGVAGSSITVFAIYMSGAFIFANQKGYLEYFPFEILPWFIVFQICGVLFYSSIFMAVGASVSQLKEAQSMLLPVWLIMMLPMFVWFNVVRDPNSTFAIASSLFPPSTPTMMVLRLATGTSIPIWQPILGVIGSIAATALCVYLAGRIFRVGILWQGKSPKFVDLFRWAVGKS